MIPIDWDSRTPTATTPDFTLTLKTGVSRALQNRLTALALPVSIDTLHPNYLAGRPHSTMRDPFDAGNRIAVLTEARSIVHELEHLQGQLVILDRAEYDPIPEFVLYKRLTRMGMLRIVIAWGIVPNGATAKGKRLGEFFFVICLQDEIEDVLTDIFKIERWFEQDEQPRPTTKAKAKRAPEQPAALDMQAKRALIEQALKEQGVRA